MLQKWSEENEKELKLAHFWTEHECLQRVLTNIINRHVVRDDGMFYYDTESEEERELRIKHQNADGYYGKRMDMYAFQKNVKH